MTFQARPLGKVGRLVVAKVPVRQGGVPAQVKIVKVLPDAGVKLPRKLTLRVPLSVAVLLPMRFT